MEPCENVLILPPNWKYLDFTKEMKLYQQQNGKCLRGKKPLSIIVT